MKQTLHSFLFLFLFTAAPFIVKAQDEITHTAGTSITVSGATTAWTTPPGTIWQNVNEADDDPGVLMATVSLPSGASSDVLVLSNFTFNIPSNYKIFSIIVNVYGTSDVVNSITVPYLQLINRVGPGFTPIPGSAVRNGFTGFETLPNKSTQSWGTICQQLCYWNTNLQPTDVNNPAFGLAIQFRNQAGVMATASMDYISIRLVLGQQIPLPVTLKGFAGNYRNQNTMLTWDTENEINFEQFEVQRSTNGDNFATIASVLPHGGNGVKAQYLYSDNLSNQTGNVFYYRLKLINKDGMGAYSKTILIRKDLKNLGAIGMYPNLVRNGSTFIKMNIVKSGDVEFRIIDVSGRILIRRKARVFEGNNTIPLDNLNQLESGTYMLQMINETGERQTVKFTVAR